MTDPNKAARDAAQRAEKYASRANKLAKIQLGMWTIPIVLGILALVICCAGLLWSFIS